MYDTHSKQSVLSYLLYCCCEGQDVSGAHAATRRYRVEEPARRSRKGCNAASIAQSPLCYVLQVHLAREVDALAHGQGCSGRSGRARASSRLGHSGGSSAFYILQQYEEIKNVQSSHTCANEDSWCIISYHIVCSGGRRRRVASMHLCLRNNTTHNAQHASTACTHPTTRISSLLVQDHTIYTRGAG